MNIGSKMMSMISLLSPQAVVYAFDMVGVVACSVSGTILARSKHFDPLGCILVAMVTAIGGGTVRDLMLARHPLFWMIDMNYLLVITVTSLLFQVFFDISKRIDKMLQLSDAIGLAAFTLIGIKVASSMGANPLIATLMGITTIIVGGMIRDIICNEIPLVLRREIYIVAAMVGAMVYFSLLPVMMSGWLREILTMLTIFCVRMLAIHFDWHLPALQRHI